MTSTPPTGGDATFRPAWWLPGPHAQTLGARWLRSRLRVPLQRERLELPDGDFVDLDFAYRRRHALDGRPLTLVLHGLEGSARSGYALESYRRLRGRGIASLGLNFRSCSGEPNRLPRFYHSGDTDDLRFVLERLSRRFPGRRLAAIGFSLGGNVLLKLLGEEGARAAERIGAAVAVSVPFDLAAGADELNRASCRLYRAHLLASLKRKTRQRRASLPASVDAARGLAAKTFREFDDAVTAPLHGFADAEDYYARSSSGRFLVDIAVPTLVLHSADDPFLPARCLPRDAVRTNPALTDGFTERGGHLGFVAGAAPFRGTFWAEERAARFVAARTTG